MPAKFFLPSKKNPAAWSVIHAPSRASKVLTLTSLKRKVEGSFLASFASRRKVGRDGSLTSRLGFAKTLSRAFADLDRLHRIDPTGKMNESKRRSLESARSELFDHNLSATALEKREWEIKVGLVKPPKRLSPSACRRKAARAAFFSAATPTLPRSAWKKFRARTENSGLNKLIRASIPRNRRRRTRRNPQGSTAAPAENTVRGASSVASTAPSSTTSTPTLGSSTLSLANSAALRAEEADLTVQQWIQNLYPNLEHDDWEFLHENYSWYEIRGLPFRDILRAPLGNYSPESRSQLLDLLRTDTFFGPSPLVH
jgi:hypothetical protein